MQFEDSLGDGKAGELHELVQTIAAGGHELGVEGGGGFGGDCLGGSV